MTLLLVGRLYHRRGSASHRCVAHGARPVRLMNMDQRQLYLACPLALGLMYSHQRYVVHLSTLNRCQLHQ